MITISLDPANKKYYKNIVKRIYSDIRNTRCLVSKQYGTSGTHLHFHIFITAVVKRTALTQRMIAYMKPVPAQGHFLNIKSNAKLIYFYNYCKRDPSNKFIAYRGIVLAQLKKQSIIHPDIKHRPKLCIGERLMEILKGLKYKEGDNLQHYLEIIRKDYNIDQIISNPRKMALFVKYYLSKNKEAWADVFKVESEALTYRRWA